MKKLLAIPLLAFLIFFELNLWSQEKCKVLMPAIADQYVGKCKKGLANGKGVAIGVDRYEGSFRKGYPCGLGVYTWASGEVYDGEWMDGKRQGLGTLSYTKNGKLAVMAGVWKDDRYVGPKPEKPKVLASSSIERFFFQRQGDGNQITINFFLNGNNNINLQDFTIVTTSGTRFDLNGKVGFESILFPFTCKVTYFSWNKTHTSRVFSRFEFQITQPGRWVLNLHNN